MVGYCAIVEYDGTDYRGFQRQRASQPTVQGAIETTLTKIAKKPVAVAAAGRTDSGVHATGQVIRFDLAWSHSCEELERAMNATLPADISVRAVQCAPERFHPRFSAQRRAYRYYIYNKPIRSVHYRRMSWHVPYELDIIAMNQAANVLLGTHDFGTFGQPPQGENRVRELFHAYWYEEEPFLVFFIEANAFLYRMVRSLVGSLVAVGSNQWSVEDFAVAFAAADRDKAGRTAPPTGLFLNSVLYEEDGEQKSIDDFSGDLR